MILENLLPEKASSAKRLKTNIPMKMSLYLCVLLSFFCQRSIAQTLTIINESKARIYYQVFASDNNTNSNNKYASLTFQVEPNSKKVYRSSGEITWSDHTPHTQLVYTGFKGIFCDPSGECTIEASDIIGSSAYNYKAETTLNTTKCNGTAGNLNLLWSNKNGNVTVRIK